MQFFRLLSGLQFIGMALAISFSKIASIEPPHFSTPQTYNHIFNHFDTDRYNPFEDQAAEIILPSSAHQETIHPENLQFFQHAHQDPYIRALNQ